jgi:uncharacterized protein YndB with AHSA1/START domain
MAEPPAHVYTTYIASTPERVWEALTDPEFTKEYWAGRRIDSDWQAGSPVRNLRDDGGADWEGEVLAAEPGRLLSYTFHMLISDKHRQDSPSRITFEIEPMGAVVKLTITHDHFEPGSTTWETTRYGWPAILSSLKSLLETGRPLPFAGLGFGPSRRREE